MAYKRKCRRSSLPALPDVIANAFCNRCVKLPNFDLLFISLFNKIIFVVSY